MMKFAISTVIAGGLFAGLLGATGVAHAAGSDAMFTASGAPTRIYDAGGYDAPSPMYYDATTGRYYDARGYEIPAPIYDGRGYEIPAPIYDAHVDINLPFGMGQAAIGTAAPNGMR